MMPFQRLRAQFGPLVLLAALSSCASGQIAVESDPSSADVSLVSAAGARQKIGQTPMTLTPSGQPGAFAGDAQIEIAKEGFRTETFLLPPQPTGASGRIQTKLVEDPVSKSCRDSATSMTEATDAVAQIQRMIHKRDYLEAERSLASYVAKFPAVPVFHGLLGNVYYLQKNFDKALGSYRRAQALQPQNAETARMVQKLESLRPSTGGTN